MTIREIFDESVRAESDGKISNATHSKILDTEIVPRKLVEITIEKINSLIKEAELDMENHRQLRYGENMVVVYTGKITAYKDCIYYLNKFLDEFERAEE